LPRPGGATLAGRPRDAVRTTSAQRNDHRCDEPGHGLRLNDQILLKPRKQRQRVRAGQRSAPGALRDGNTIDLWRKPARQARWVALFGIFLDVSHRPNRSPYEAAVLADSPEVYWRLDDKSCTAEDASGHHNTSTYLGKPALSAQPLIADNDKAVHLDGKDDQVTFPDSTSLSPTKAISVEAWVRPDDVPTSPDAAWQLVSKWNTVLFVLRGGSNPKFAFSLYDASTSSCGPTAVGTTTVKPGRVYHLVGTYDGSKIRTYVNGSLESTVTYDGGLNDSTYGGVLAAPGWGTLPSPLFRGTVDEVAVYGHALTNARVEHHYRIGTGRSAGAGRPDAPGRQAARSKQ
jgi:hypothetical protein